MMKLYISPPAFGLRNASPFCLKVEMALNFFDHDHEIEILRDPRKAPKGKLPFIEADGNRIADSELVFEWLDKRTQGGIYRNLTAREKARGTALTRLAEDHLYWLIVASRWLDDDWWPNVEGGFFSELPRVVRAVVAPVARRQVRQAYSSQGLGRHSIEEQKRFASRDLQAISAIVEASEFLVGSEVTPYDFAVAAQLSSLLDNKPATWATALAEAYPGLRRYAERVQEVTGTYGRQV